MFSRFDATCVVANTGNFEIGTISDLKSYKA